MTTPVMASVSPAAAQVLDLVHLTADEVDRNDRSKTVLFIAARHRGA